MRCRYFVIVLCFLLALNMSVSAQNGAGSTVTGFVTDVFGSVVPDALVIAIDKNGETYETKTNNVGHYELKTPAGGVYKVLVIRKPYKAFIVDEYQMINDGKLNLDISLICADCETLSLPFKDDNVATNDRVPTQASSPANKSATDKCDFSAYAPVRILHFDSKSVIKKVEPQYPAEAEQHRIQGRVIVNVLINKSGDVEKSCATEGDGTLRPFAEKAALQWKFKPGYGLAFLRPKTKRIPRTMRRPI